MNDFICDLSVKKILIQSHNTAKNLAKSIRPLDFCFGISHNSRNFSKFLSQYYLFPTNRPFPSMKSGNPVQVITTGLDALGARKTQWCGRLQPPLPALHGASYWPPRSNPWRPRLHLCGCPETSHQKSLRPAPIIERSPPAAICRDRNLGYRIDPCMEHPLY